LLLPHAGTFLRFSDHRPCHGLIDGTDPVGLDRSKAWWAFSSPAAGWNRDLVFTFPADLGFRCCFRFNVLPTLSSSAAFRSVAFAGCHRLFRRMGAIAAFGCSMARSRDRPINFGLS
jgi:hypothetical protein